MSTVLDIIKSGYIVPPGLFGGVYRIRQRSMLLERNLLRMIYTIYAGYKDEKYDKFFHTRYSNLTEDLETEVLVLKRNIAIEMQTVGCPLALKDYLELLILHIQERVSVVNNAWVRLYDAKKIMGQ